jgi:23S rRNA (cytidine1920-2'-O)/16S rRNA (cytidine1409-2'-O)-methyltransferase
LQKQRLDVLVVERGLVSTRERARALILAGQVRVNDQVVSKAGTSIAVDARISLAVPDHPYVGRGGIKLAHALDRLGVDPAGRDCLDVGASTGGFTDCLLKRGARHVVALDVGRGELHPSLRADERVTPVERVNARALGPAVLPYAPDLIVVDVSFISLSKVLPAVLAAASPEFDCLALVKPQFEVGPGRVGKGGAVRSAEDRHAAVDSVVEFAGEGGWSVRGVASSGLPGPAGNRETFVWLGP